VDGDHAELMYRRSRLAMGVGDTNAAPGFARARDLDTLRFRADSDLNGIIRKVAAGREADGVWLVDAERTFAQNAPGGIPGDELFWEHVHFRLPGSYLLALLTGTALLEALPTSLREGAQADWIKIDEVSRRLAVTSWGDHRIVEGVRSRCRKPPFSMQANAAEREARLQKEQAGLAKGLMPTAFNPQADAYRKRIAEAPGDWVLHDQFGRLHESFGDVAGATNEWRKVIELVPHHFGARLQLGRMLATRDETAAQAEAWLREADRMRPGTAEVHAALGLALARQKRHADANAAFAMATRLRPDLLEAHVQWGVALAGEGRDSEAIARLGQALAISSNSALSHLHLARIARKQGDTNGARMRYAEVLRLSPGYREAREFMGLP
jgi:tetratricopeptide (TPR) repeat protein